VCYFIEAARYVLPDGADRSGCYEKREHDGANTPATFGQRCTIVVMRRHIEIAERKHRANVHSTRK